MVHIGTQLIPSCTLWWISLLQTSPPVCLPFLPAEAPSSQLSGLLTPLEREMQCGLALAMDPESRGSVTACHMQDKYCGDPETICSCPTVLEKGHYCQIPCKKMNKEISDCFDTPVTSSQTQAAMMFNSSARLIHQLHSPVVKMPTAPHRAGKADMGYT